MMMVGWQRRMIVERVGWSMPSKSWAKLNTDACVHKGNGIAGARGVLRDDKGVWIFSFSTNLGCCTAEEAEVWRLLYDLRMAWETGERRIRVEVDSLMAIKWIKGGQEVVNSQANLINECKEWLGRSWITNF